MNEKLRANQIISRTLAIMAIRGNQIMSYSKLQNKRFIISNRSRINQLDLEERFLYLKLSLFILSYQIKM